jgi:DNA polymerase-3 subunit gamma/tau
MRDALTIFDQTVAFCGTDVKYQDVLRNLNVLDYEYSFSLVDAFLKGDYPSALLTFDEVLTKGFNALHFVAALSSHLRDLIISKSGGLDALLEMPDSLKKKYKEQTDRCPLQFLYEALNLTTQCESGYRASVNPRLHIEFTLMRLSFLLARPADSPAPVVAPAPAVAPSATVSQKTGDMVGSSQPPLPPQPSAAPVAPAPAPAPVAPAPVAAPVPAPAPTPAAESAAQPRERRRATRAGGLSLKSMMEETPAADALAVKSTDAPAPEDAAIKAMWPELAEKYSDKPRLASMLTSSTLSIEMDGDYKVVTFRVVNEAQKDWVESKLLHELESTLRILVESAKVNLRVSVVPDEPAATKKAYMPSEQAKELMDQNAEVKSLVQDLGLDIK